MVLRAHLIYDVIADRDLKEALVEQSRQPDSPFEIADKSPASPTMTWHTHAAQGIQLADVVLFICGANTDHPAGTFNTELQMTQAVGKPYILIAGRGEESRKPRTARDTDELIDSDWESVKAAVGG